MNKYIYEAKNYEEAVGKALTDLNTTEENLLIKILEEKNTLLKKIVKIEVVKYSDITSYLKDITTKILKEMGLTTNLEIKKRENHIDIKTENRELENLETELLSINTEIKEILEKYI